MKLVFYRNLRDPRYWTSFEGSGFDFFLCFLIVVVGVSSGNVDISIVLLSLIYILEKIVGSENIKSNRIKEFKRGV